MLININRDITDNYINEKSGLHSNFDSLATIRQSDIENIIICLYDSAPVKYKFRSEERRVGKECPRLC